MRARLRSRSDMGNRLPHPVPFGIHCKTAPSASTLSVMRTVLISGAGVAGPTLAYWLARAGLRPTVVERANGQRSSGSPVALRAAATQATGIRFVDSSGRLSRRMSMPATRSAAGTPEIEVPRADLARILCAAARDDAE